MKEGKRERIVVVLLLLCIMNQSIKRIEEERGEGVIPALLTNAHNRMSAFVDNNVSVAFASPCTSLSEVTSHNTGCMLLIFDNR